MYGAFWCPHCLRQKELFGNSFDKINYVECSLPDKSDQTQVCKDAKIESYPTWEFADGSRATGERTLEELGNKAGCAVTEG
jgi:glutaredoxin